MKAIGWYRAAMRSIFSELVRSNRLVVVEDFAVDQPKTKLLAEKLAEMQLDNVLIIGDEVSENLYLSARNLHRVAVSDVAGVDPVSLVGCDKVLMTVPAVKKFEELLG